MSQNHQVTQIIIYLTKKVEKLQKQLQEYESPIMQEMAKNASHLQYDYVRVKAQLESYEDTLLAIQTFTNEPENGEGSKSQKAKGAKAKS